MSEEHYIGDDLFVSRDVDGEYVLTAANGQRIVLGLAAFFELERYVKGKADTSEMSDELDIPGISGNERLAMWEQDIAMAGDNIGEEFISAVLMLRHQTDELQSLRAAHHSLAAEKEQLDESVELRGKATDFYKEELAKAERRAWVLQDKLAALGDSLQQANYQLTKWAAAGREYRAARDAVTDGCVGTGNDAMRRLEEADAVLDALLASPELKNQPDNFNRAGEVKADHIPDAGNKVCGEILGIMKVYREQAETYQGVDSPGGLEHMGDVWSLFHRWESELLADVSIESTDAPGLVDETAETSTGRKFRLVVSEESFRALSAEIGAEALRKNFIVDQPVEMDSEPRSELSTPASPSDGE